ncbi:glycosyltransferase [uncultured Erythrobacter sp.]|uniref:glycosyltransferase n=1 Tax=uncultured Erythrobacter sp. TaxID=263913 RepID=UPI002634BA1C|nr:glycosyltransferase [uncultured Erythrobacter sp.]
MIPKVTITLTRYAEPDALVSRAIVGALAQEGVSGEILFFDQNVSSTLSVSDFKSGTLTLKVVRGALRSLSDARNAAIGQARYDTILFLDSDAVPEAGWAKAMAETLSHPKCAVAGSRIEPGWPAPPPPFAKARALLDQYSLLDLGRERRVVNKVVGAGFGMDRAKLPKNFKFDPDLGRRDGRLFGGEETDFCKRAQALGYEVQYCGKAAVTHLIQPERMAWGWIAKRMIYAGYGRAQQGGAPSPSRTLELADYLFMPFYLPPYAAGWAWGRFAKWRERSG